MGPVLRLEELNHMINGILRAAQLRWGRGLFLILDCMYLFEYLLWKVRVSDSIFIAFETD